MRRNKHGWKTVSSKVVYKNPWIKVKNDAIYYPNGKQGVYGVVEKGPGVAIIAVNIKREILLVKQYRYTLNQDFYELPAGAILKNETALGSAKRELYEEAGLKARKWRKLGNYFTALGHETAEIIAFLAQDLAEEWHSLAHQQHDESILEVLWLPPEKLRRFIASGKLECGISLAALGLLQAKHPEPLKT
jgi:8-oxo-dGTP pyrophosphatase MutT (NUDIX family)